MAQGLGWRDKLYWRPRVSMGRVMNFPWHCYKKSGKWWEALCGQAVIYRTGGQDCRRPDPLMRCGRCDGLEMERRGWEESGRNKPDGLLQRN